MKEPGYPYSSTVSGQDTPPIIGSIHSIPISDISPMPDSPFKIREDAAMQELIESVAQFGVLVPIEVRPRESGGYEIVSGARRQNAASLAGLDSLPAIILDLDDDDAVIRMVDSNIQRENILPSERAFAYKMRMEAIKRKAGRPGKYEKENSPKISANFRSDDTVGEMAGISGDTVRNYISLTQLIPEIMQMVDDTRERYGGAVTEKIYLNRVAFGNLICYTIKKNPSKGVYQYAARYS